MPRFAKGSKEAMEWGQKMRMMKKSGKKSGNGLIGNVLKGVSRFGLNKLADMAPLPDMIKNPLKEGAQSLLDKGIDKTGLGVINVNNNKLKIRNKKSGGALYNAGMK